MKTLHFLSYSYRMETNILAKFPIQTHTQSQRGVVTLFNEEMNRMSHQTFSLISFLTLATLS